MNKCIYVYLIVISFVYHSCVSQNAEYQYVGKYEYEITNDSLFQNTYLHDSFGFLIGDLKIQGLKIKGIESLPSDTDYIVSLHHPLKNVYVNSQQIESEGQEHLVKKPLDIIQNKNESSHHVYLYRLGVKGKYRLLLP